MLHKNNLKGEIPSELGELSTLKWLWLYDNELERGIPPQLGGLSGRCDGPVRTSEKGLRILALQNSVLRPCYKCN